MTIDAPDWASSTQPPAPAATNPWVSPNQPPLAYLVNAGNHLSIVTPATATTQVYLFDLTVALEPTGSAAYVGLEYGAFGVYTTFQWLSVFQNQDPVVLNFHGVPLPVVGGVGAGLYLSLVGTLQPVLGGVTYSKG